MSYLCPTCGKVHGVSNVRRIDHGPDNAGTVAELYPTSEVPPSLADLVGDSVACEGTGELVKLDNPARLSLWPWGAPPKKHRLRD